MRVRNSITNLNSKYSWKKKKQKKINEWEREFKFEKNKIKEKRDIKSGRILNLNKRMRIFFSFSLYTFSKYV